MGPFTRCRPAQWCPWKVQLGVSRSFCACVWLCVAVSGETYGLVMSELGASDSGMGTRIGAGHELLGRPRRTAPPLTVSAPLLLNTHELDWEGVEHLVAWLTRRVEGWDEAWRYGTQGQNQHGIDVVGVRGTDAVVFQAKKLKRFTKADLERAVTRFVRGKRPFGASRFVVVTTHDADRTEIYDRLVDLRREHQDLEIELWNRERLSNLLRPHPDIVTAFFGAATTAVFCPVPVAPAVTRAELLGEQPDAQALLRGPVAHLGLDGELEAADRQLDSAPDEAAAVYGSIAEQLEQTVYAPYARTLRARQAAALHAASESDAAVRVDLSSMARDLTAGRVFNVRRTLLKLVDKQVSADDALIRTVNTLGRLAEFEFEHSVTLDDVTEYLDQQLPSDPSVVQAATLFAEHAIADHRPELVTQRVGLLERIAGVGTNGERDTARLRACLADVEGSGAAWRDLMRWARHTCPFEVRGLLAARRARFLAVTGDMTSAVEGYYDAVEHALAARMHQDAAEWIFAQRLVISRNAQASEEHQKIFDAQDFEQVLLQTSRDSVLPMTSDIRASAMLDLLRDKFHEARQSLLQYRRRAVALGSWGHERDAEYLMARLHMKVGNVTQAMRHFVHSGVTATAKEVRRFLPELPNEPLAWQPPEGLDTYPAGNRSCAFAITARVADLLPDDAARMWIDAALQELDAPPSRTRGSTSSAEPAWSCMAKLAQASTLPQAQRLAAIAQTRAPSRREADSRARAVIAMAEVHNHLAAAAVRDLTRTALHDEGLAGAIVIHGERLFTRHGHIVSTECRIQATQGNLRAVQLLLLAEAETDTCREVIARWLQQEAPGDRAELSRAELVLMGEDLLPPSVLAASAQPLAEHVRHPTHGDTQRWALDTLAVAAAALPSLSQREPYVALAMATARGDITTREVDELTRDHPLDRFRFHMGPSMLRQQGLVTAARLSESDAGLASDIVTLALTQLSQATDSEARLIARALSHLEPLYLPPLTTLTVHPQPWIRCLAANLAAPSVSDHHRCRALLVDDPDWRVRVNLARHLPDDHELLPRLRLDANRQVRDAALRARLSTRSAAAPSPPG